LVLCSILPACGTISGGFSSTATLNPSRAMRNTSGNGPVSNQKFSPTPIRWAYSRSRSGVSVSGSTVIATTLTFPFVRATARDNSTIWLISAGHGPGQSVKKNPANQISPFRSASVRGCPSRSTS